jgi:hypothetical protein
MLEDHHIIFLVFLVDIASVVIRVSSGVWSTQAKLGLLASHLALLSLALRLMTEKANAWATTR